MSASRRRLFQLLIVALVPAGCSSTRGLGTGQVESNIRTTASTGDKPLPAVSGEPGASVAADVDVDDVRPDERGRISGRVVDDRGDPIPGVRVRLADGGKTGGRVVRATTDGAGGFTLRGLRAGSQYTLIAEHEDEQGVRIGRASALAPDQDVRIDLVDETEEGSPSRLSAPRNSRKPKSRVRPVADDGGDASDDEEEDSVSNPDDLPPPAEELDDHGERPSRKPIRQSATDSPSRGRSTWKAGPPRPISRPLVDSELEPRPAPRAEPAPAPSIMPVDSVEEDIVNPLPPALNPARPERPAPEPPPAEPALNREDVGAATTPTPTPGAIAAAAPVPALPEPAPSPVAAVEPEPAAPTMPGPAPEMPPVAAAEPVADASTAPALPDESGPTAEAAAVGPAPAPMPELVEMTEPPAPMPAPAPPEPTPAAAPPEPTPVTPPDRPAGEGQSGFPPDADDYDAIAAVRAFQEAPEAVIAAKPKAAPTASPPAVVPREASREPVRNKPTWGDIPAPAPDADAGTITRASLRSELEAPILAAEAKPAELPREVRRAGRAVNKAECRYDTKHLQLVDFRLPGLDGNFVRFRDLDADFVLLDFWGTWCGPCVTAVPHLVDLQGRYNPGTLRVVGVACEQVPAERRRALVGNSVRKLKINYPVLLSGMDGPCPVQEAFQIQVYPTMILVDRQGRVVWRNEGATPLSLARLDRVIENATRAKPTLATSPAVAVK